MQHLFRNRRSSAGLPESGNADTAVDSADDGQPNTTTADPHHAAPRVPPRAVLGPSVFSTAGASRSLPLLPMYQRRPPTPNERLATGTGIESHHGRSDSNPPRYSVSNMDSVLAEHPLLCQRRTPLGHPPGRGLRAVLQDLREGSFQDMLPCKSFRMVTLLQMPPEPRLFVGFFNSTALAMKEALMRRSGKALEVDHNGVVQVNDEAIARLDLKNRGVRVVARRRRVQGSKFIECVILDARVDPADGKCDVLYEVRWMST